jgi:hypothetical protein
MTSACENNSSNPAQAKGRYAGGSKRDRLWARTLYNPYTGLYGTGAAYYNPFLGIGGAGSTYSSVYPAVPFFGW